MGRLVLLWRLVSGDIARRKAQSTLLVVMIATTTTTLTLGLALRGISDNPFAHTRAATRGPDVVAMYGVWGFSHPPGTFPGSLARFEALTRAPGVVGSSGPYPVGFPRLTARGLGVQVLAEGRDSRQATVDQPLLTAGRWVTPGGVVIERAFADALGVHVGQPIRVAGRVFRIVGIALSTSQSVYPEGFGMVWLTGADLQRVEAMSRPAGYLLNLKLADPRTAPPFAAEHAAPLPSRQAWQAWSLESWQDIRTGDLKVITTEQGVLLTVSWLLGVLASATIAVLVGGRMAEQTRRVGLLKAVGATPRLIAMILLAENLLLALAAAILGLTAGRLLAPTLIEAGTGVLGTPSSSPLTLATAGLIVLVAVIVAAAATVAPVVRGARTSTITALTESVHPPHRRPWLITLSALLPVPLLLALRLIARRIRRTVLTAVSLGIAVTMIVVTLIMQHEINTKNTAISSKHHAGMLPGTFIVDRVSHLVFLLSTIMIVLAAISTIITTWTTVIDSQRSTALARTLGATPRQITAALATAQLFPALAAAGLGIPVGLGLYRLADHGGQGSAPLPWLLAVIPGTLIAVAALTAIPARIGANRPVAEVLRSE
ncbi:MAG: FtsX-like permease family protein [Solirubrobacteraceae bacterium]